MLHLTIEFTYVADDLDVVLTLLRSPAKPLRPCNLSSHKLVRPRKF